MRRARMVATIGLLLTAGAGICCIALRREPAPTGLVIITLDTTRADRLSAYGNTSAATPYLERLAREGTVFDHAASVAPLTLPAHCSLFTGLYPLHHGVRDNTGPALTTDNTTLAETLRGYGFRTAAFVGATVLEADRGLARGFDRYSSVAEMDRRERANAPMGQRRADGVVTAAIRWIEQLHDSRFFVWIHLYDPHRPYDPPEPFRTRYDDRYTGEIAFVDSQIGRLIDILVQRQLLDRTLVVIAGDHGESLGDHGERDHGIFVYESVLRVPLIIRAPHVAPRRVARIVRLIDVMPSILDLLGLPGVPGDGVSLAPMIRGDPHQPELDAYLESMDPRRYGWSALRALRDGRYKLIAAPRPELYDLERDPYEQHSIYQASHPAAIALARRLATLDRDVPLNTSAEAEHSILSDVRQRVASLGYVAADPVLASVAGPALPDPKDCIDTLFRRDAALRSADTHPESRQSPCPSIRSLEWTDRLSNRR